MERTNHSVTMWRKSTFSGGNGSNCVEVGAEPGHAVAVRDTKDRAGALLTFGAEAWQRFAATIKNADRV